MARKLQIMSRKLGNWEMGKLGNGEMVIKAAKI
jgi:hypothetical protein